MSNDRIYFSLLFPSAVLLAWSVCVEARGETLSGYYYQPKGRYQTLGSCISPVPVRLSPCHPNCPKQFLKSSSSSSSPLSSIYPSNNDCLHGDNKVFTVSPSLLPCRPLSLSLSLTPLSAMQSDSLTWLRADRIESRV